MAGRPKAVIDYQAVEKLANIQCTQDEIARFIGVSTRTLQKDEKFMELFNKGRDSGKMSIRRMQFKIAEKGNASMAIWLGKQYLGQRDTVEVSNTDELNKVKELLGKIEDGANK